MYVQTTYQVCLVSKFFWELQPCKRTTMNRKVFFLTNTHKSCASLNYEDKMTEVWKKFRFQTPQGRPSTCLHKKPEKHILREVQTRCVTHCTTPASNLLFAAASFQSLAWPLKAKENLAAKAVNKMITVVGVVARQGKGEMIPWTEFVFASKSDQAKSLAVAEFEFSWEP